MAHHELQLSTPNFNLAFKALNHGELVDLVVDDSGFAAGDELSVVERVTEPDDYTYSYILCNVVEVGDCCIKIRCSRYKLG